jgi:membrane fusion protein
MEIRLREMDSEVERLRMAMEEAEREVEAALARRNSIISTYGERELAHSTDQGETLVSPIDGVLIDFTVDESSYFPAGAIIARVARENAQLAVELWVPSKAIGNIEEGTPVTVKLSSLPHRQHGTLAATLVSIADAPRPKERNPFEFESGAQYYRVIAHIDPKSSSPDINISRLRAGISLTADIHVHERSLISYVIDPLRNLR